MDKITFWQEKELKAYRFGIYETDIKVLEKYPCNHNLFHTPYIEVLCEELPTKDKEISIEFYAQFAGSDERIMLASEEYVGDKRGLKRFVKKYITEEIMAEDIYDLVWLSLVKRIDRTFILDDDWDENADEEMGVI